MVVAQRKKTLQTYQLSNIQQREKKRRKLRLSKNEPQHKIQEVTRYLPS